MIRSYYIQLKNEKLEEVVLGLDKEFPYTSIYAAIDKFVGGYAPWHWHSEFEFFFVIKGSVSYHLEDGIYDFAEGEVGFINSNVLHMTTPAAEGPCISSVQIMDKQFIAGHLGSLLESKYIEPIIRSSNLKIYKFTKDNKAHDYILAELCLAFECEKERVFGYEFQIRNHISNMWLKFFKSTKSIIEENVFKKNADSNRIKAMILFINQHFSEKLTLGQIAKEANISEREAMRCFQRCVKMSPFAYLTERRVQEAADRLKRTDESVMTVGEICGFSSGSYFGKVFKERMGCSPNAFRKRIYT
jgi:AraC-like DNA-binding protein/quercetin dioxygenase-like cupin family protein